MLLGIAGGGILALVSLYAIRASVDAVLSAPWPQRPAGTDAGAEPAGQARRRVQASASRS